MGRRFRQICLVLLLLVIGGVLVVHTPPVRSYALALAVRAALNRGIQIEATGLDYNLVTRRVRLSNVRVSAVGDPRPFLIADQVSATASSRVFFGEIAFDDVSIGNRAPRGWHHEPAGDVRLRRWRTGAPPHRARERACTGNRVPR